MRKNKDYKPEDIAFPNQVIVESELVKEMKDSYIDYAILDLSFQMLVAV